MIRFIKKLLKAQLKKKPTPKQDVRSRPMQYPEKLKDLDDSYRALVRELAKR
ncbi:hypothetical protein HY213_02730 [Candidatus Peregrinibacteria bacterium]|nr:hypothetical protein [Candidatus Peregrinibacteria bacterium]